MSKAGTKVDAARRSGWPRLALAGGLALALPKCLACVAGYIALGTGLAATSPELCGVLTDAAVSPGQGSAALAVVTFLGACWLLRKRA